jgi:hypothetical protein
MVTQFAPPPEAEADPEREMPDVLFEEARRRRRKRWFAGSASSIAAAIVGLTVGLSGNGGGSAGAAARDRQRGPADGGSIGAAALAHDRWRVLARSPIGAPPFGASVVWDGHELLELGGSGTFPRHLLRRGAAEFDPTTGRWRRIASIPSAVWPANDLTAWTGSRLFVIGRSSHGISPSSVTAGLYDPASNTWKLTTPVPVRLGPAGLGQAVWWAGRVILTAVSGSGNNETGHVMAYDPATNHWTVLPLGVPQGHDPNALVMVGTGRRLLLWSMWSRGRSVAKHTVAVFSGVDVYRLVGGAWRRLNIHWPQHRTVTPIAAGSRVLLASDQPWCGWGCSTPPGNGGNGWSVNPETLTVTRLPPGPFDFVGPQVLWTGAAEISFNANGRYGNRVLPGDIAFLNLAEHRWYLGPRAPRNISGSTAAWDGDHVLVLDQRGQLLSYGP